MKIENIKSGYYESNSHHKELLCQEGVKVLHSDHVQVDREPLVNMMSINIDKKMILGKEKSKY